MQSVPRACRPADRPRTTTFWSRLVMPGLLIGLAVSATVGATEFFDAFEDGDTSLWQTFEPGWIESGGVYQATNTAADVEVASVVEDGYGWTDYVVEADVTPLAQTFSSSAGLVFRFLNPYPDPEHYCHCALNAGSGQVRLFLGCNGSAVYELMPFSWTPGSTYRLRATAHGEHVSCEVLGHPGAILEGWSGGVNLTGTAGLRGTHIATHFDNFSVTPLGPEVWPGDTGSLWMRISERQAPKVMEFVGEEDSELLFEIESSVRGGRVGVVILDPLDRPVHQQEMEFLGAGSEVVRFTPMEGGDHRLCLVDPSGFGDAEPHVRVRSTADRFVLAGGTWFTTWFDLVPPGPEAEQQFYFHVAQGLADFAVDLTVPDGDHSSEYAEIEVTDSDGVVRGLLGVGGNTASFGSLPVDVPLGTDGQLWTLRVRHEHADAYFATTGTPSWFSTSPSTWFEPERDADPTLCVWNPDGDGDGVPDAEDHCPDAGADGPCGGPVDEDGCPLSDYDGDRVCNDADFCRWTGDGRYGIRYGATNLGCPVGDADGDRIPDTHDLCAWSGDRGLGIRNGGCPAADADGDGMPNRLDYCAWQDPGAGFIKPGGCRAPASWASAGLDDADGDRIPTLSPTLGTLDLCPDHGPGGFGIDRDGCPISDADGDSMPDGEDHCVGGPTAEFGMDRNGCPIGDSDGDGVPDPDDACPEVAGLRMDRGC